MADNELHAQHKARHWLTRGHHWCAWLPCKYDIEAREKLSKADEPCAMLLYCLLIQAQDKHDV